MVAMTHIEQVFLVHSTTLLHTRQTYATYLPMQIHSQQEFQARFNSGWLLSYLAVKPFGDGIVCDIS